jgi:hypothetical protein
MTFYITLVIDVSRDLYPNNTIAMFRVRLPRPVELLKRAWEVEIFELYYPAPMSETAVQPIFVYSDLIEPQMVGDTFARCLRIVHYPPSDGYHTFDKVYYVPLEKTDFKTVNLEVLTNLGERVPLPDSTKPLVAVRHFRRRV